MDPAAARHDLDAWRASRPEDPYASDRDLCALNRHYLDGDRLATLERRASEFGRRVVTELGAAAAEYEQRTHLPELARYDGVGHRVETVRFDPAYHRAGAMVWESGLIADSGTRGRAFEQATLLYLLSLEGEAGHACPATCTIGLARALRRHAADDVRKRFLPPLLETGYASAERGAQFLTEVQGGSDVGANACRAVPCGSGCYALSGEKWFCSVADADQFLVTARPEGAPDGTRGLGCFVVPRLLDGKPNGFTLRRLKDKLGTRGMASGEIDFDGAVAWPIGPLDQGFKIAAGVVLNTSRWMTAIGSTGMMRRAVLEASAYARHRQAFGRAIQGFPMVRQTLASMSMDWLAALHLVWLLTALEDRIDAEVASDDDVLLHRFLVNAAKYAVSARASRVVARGIEVLGGNGTIEDFSVLPRLYRDTIVYESWEGTHNVLVNQVLNDARRLPILEVVGAWAREMLSKSGSAAADHAAAVLPTTLADLHRAVDDAEFGATHFRRLLDRIVLLLQVAVLEQGRSERAAAAAEMLVRLRLDRAYRPEADPRFLDKVDAIS